MSYLNPVHRSASLRFILIAAFLLLITLTVNAQTNPIPDKGSRELGFLYLTPGGDSDYPGGFTFNYTTYRSGKSAIRYGMSLIYSTSSQKSKNAETDTLNANERDTKWDATHFAFAIHPQYMILLAETQSLQGWIGFGPYLGYDYATTTEDQSYFSDTVTRDPDNSRETTSNYWNVGLYSSIAIDWKIVENVAITATYGLKLYYSTDETIETDKNYYTYGGASTEKTKTTTNEFYLRTTTVALGLRFYF